MFQLVCHLRPEKKINYRLTHTLIRVVQDSQKAFPSLIRVQQNVVARPFKAMFSNANYPSNLET